ncbi:GNAT family N-acetyltransferase [Oceanibacterium hippocampi]|uniref:BioF2-like acetyltransferase domain-containing protein n=1 Tax=Oceanibacterium hippocampi TaxID=745714 RepID=A0A1Y5TPS8_9PROT|nr:GNAT family N-acetyltransferase [Oceanibacterium hippocampi]SLN69154.1 hypothetical protein OCH7691_03161 [Oceanibacterium hippocampi]
MTMIFRAFEGADGLPPEFGALMAADDAGGVYSSLPWYRNFVATCLDAGDRPLFATVARSDGTPLALLAVRLVDGTGDETGWRRRVQRAEGMSNFYSCAFAPVLADTDDRAAALGTLVQGLAETLSDRDLLTLRAMPVEAPVFAELEQALRQAGFVTERFFHFGNWYESVGDTDFEGYMARRPSRLRNTLKRKSRRFAAHDGAALRIEDGSGDLEAAIAGYEAVYRQSWKDPEPYPDFTAGLIRKAAAAGALRLGTAWVGETPAAVQLWLVWSGRATIFKLAYDETFRDHSLGTVLTAHMARHAIEVDRVSEIDFGCGDDSYKSDWLGQRRERWGIAACNRHRPAGLALALRARAKALVRRLSGR